MPLNVNVPYACICLPKVTALIGNLYRKPSSEYPLLVQGRRVDPSWIFLARSRVTVIQGPNMIVVNLEKNPRLKYLHYGSKYLFFNLKQKYSPTIVPPAHFWGLQGGGEWMRTDVMANSWLQRTKPLMKMAPLPGSTGFGNLVFEARVQSWRVGFDG